MIIRLCKDKERAVKLKNTKFKMINDFKKKTKMSKSNN